MDFIPSKRSNRYLWYKNISDNAVASAAAVGAPSADGVALKAHADAIIAKMDAVEAAKAALEAARSQEGTTEAASQAGIRAIVRNWKTLAGFAASGVEGTLKIKGEEPAFDPGTYKPVIKVKIEGGQIRIEFNKLGVDGMKVYCRLRGTSAWRFLDIDKESPYFDTAPLAQAGVPEVREYMARGMIGDDEVGLDSDIVSVTYAG